MQTRARVPLTRRRFLEVARSLPGPPEIVLVYPDATVVRLPCSYEDCSMDCLKGEELISWFGPSENFCVGLSSTPTRFPHQDLPYGCCEVPPALVEKYGLEVEIPMALKQMFVFSQAGVERLCKVPLAYTPDGDLPVCIQACVTAFSPQEEADGSYTEDLELPLVMQGVSDAAAIAIRQHALESRKEW